MKRFWYLVIIVAVLACLTGCGNSNNTTEVPSDVAEVTVQGKYSLFETESQAEYLEFLEELDNNKYEIVDISISRTVSNIGSLYRNYYVITYAEIDE